MLTQFSVKNYKSIRDLAVLDMAATAIKEHQEHLIQVSNDERYLPISVIYGPNGAGKSNVLKAIGALGYKVLSPIHMTSNNKFIDLNYVDIQPYAFAEEYKDLPVEFEIYFIVNNFEYNYSLSVCHDNIYEENLYRRKLDSNHSSKLFERNRKEIVVNGELQKLKISDGLSDNLPLLSYLGITYRENQVVADVIDWFENKFYFLNYENPKMDRLIALGNSPQVKEIVLQMIKELDLDIDDFRVEKLVDRKIDIYTKHTVGDFSVELNLREESSGTKKLFTILPFIARSLIFGEILVVDELDAKLHPMLLQFIIRQYTDNTINKRNAQLIFTSHDLSTMNSDNFRRDEIWFVAKGKAQESVLYSLVEFKKDGVKIRKDAKYDKQYLEGKYGADPYLKRIIDWDSVHEDIEDVN